MRNQIACPYCDTLLSNRLVNRPIWDTILDSTRNFVAAPTLGSLVEGWVLIIPKQHKLSISAIRSESERQELNRLISRLSERMEKTWGRSPTIFEHGPSEAGEKIGCGINHAHLHLVPLSFSLRSATEEFDINILSEWQELSADTMPTENLTQNRNYLYFNEPGRGAYIAFPNRDISQYFRRVIANKIGAQKKFDYKTFSFERHARLTVEKLFLTDTQPTYIEYGDRVRDFG